MIAPAASEFGIKSGKKDWKFVVSKNFVLDPGISTGAKMLYIALTSFLNEDGTCFPSRTKLMKCLNMGKDAFYKHMRELEAHGFVGRQQALSDGNRFGHTIYTVFDDPQPVGDSIIPVSGIPCAGKPDTGSKDTNSTHPETVPKRKSTQEEKEEDIPAAQDAPDSHQGKHAGKSTSKFVEFRDQWMLEFKTLFGVEYEFQGGGDGRAISKLVSNGRTVDELIVLAKTGWASKDRWIQSQCRKNISAFAACINQIATETAKPKCWV